MQCNWSYINKIFDTFFYKIFTMFIISINILSIYKSLNIDAKFSSKIYILFIGSLIFLIGYILQLAFCPDKIKKFKNEINYLKYINEFKNYLNLDIEFSFLIKDFKNKKQSNNQYYLTAYSLKSYYSYKDSGISEENALGSFCIADFELVNYSNKFYRILSLVLMFLGFLLIESATILKIINILIKGV